MNTTLVIKSVAGRPLGIVAGVQSHTQALEAGRMWLTQNPDWEEDDKTHRSPVVYLHQSDSFVYYVNPAME